MKFMLVRSRFVFFMLVAGLMISSATKAGDKDCLNGFELTAIVVLETDIRQSVGAYACRMVFPADTSTYGLYNQIRDKWKQQRQVQKNMRDNIYQRIYGDKSEAKVSAWMLTTARAQGKQFKATDASCQSLRNEMGSHSQNWQTLFNASAREAAEEKYDPLRCKTKSVITIKQ